QPGIAMLLLLIASLQIVPLQAADTISKGERITLHFEGTTLKEVLKTIEKKTPYNFFYNHRAVDVHRKVSIDLLNVPIDVAMTALLKDAGVEWKIRGTQVVLKKNRKSGTMEEALPALTHRTAYKEHDEKVVDSYLSYALRISGTVTDGNGTPLPGVNVIVKGTTIGTATDANGRYSLDVSGNDAVLVFSFIGYVTQEVVVGNQTTIDVTLVSDVMSLEEVVVVGY